MAVDAFPPPPFPVPPNYSREISGEISGPELHRAVAEELEHSIPWQGNDTWTDTEDIPDPLVDTLRRMEELLPDGDPYAHGNRPTFGWLGPNRCGVCEDRSPVRLTPVDGVLTCSRCAPEPEPPAPIPPQLARWARQSHLYLDPGPERPPVPVDMVFDNHGMAALSVTIHANFDAVTAAFIEMGHAIMRIAGIEPADFTLHGKVAPVPRTRRARLNGNRRRRHRRR